MAFGFQTAGLQPITRITTRGPNQSDAIGKFQAMGFNIRNPRMVDKSPLQQAMEQLAGMTGGMGGIFGGAFGGGDSFQEMIDATRANQESKIAQGAKDALGAALGNLGSRGLMSSSLAAATQMGVDRNKQQLGLQLDENILKQQYEYDKEMYDRSLDQAKMMQSLLGSLLR